MGIVAKDDIAYLYNSRYPRHRRCTRTRLGSPWFLGYRCIDSRCVAAVVHHARPPFFIDL